MNFQFESTSYIIRCGATRRRAEVEPLEMRRQVAEPFEQRRGLRGEADEHETLPGLHPNRDKPEVLALEVLEVLGVLRTHEVAFEVVDPGVVRALEPNRLARTAPRRPPCRDGGTRCRRPAACCRCRARSPAPHRRSGRGSTCRVPGHPPRGRRSSSRAGTTPRARSRGSPARGRPDRAAATRPGTACGRPRSPPRSAGRRGRPRSRSWS